MIAVKLIILIGVIFTLFITYSLISFYFEPHIRLYIQNKKELIKANKIRQEARDKKALEYLRSLEPEEVEAEEVNPDELTKVAYNVFYEKRLGEIKVSTELITLNND